MEYEYVIEPNGPLGEYGDEIGPVLLAIEKRDGALTPEAVVEEAKRLPRTHPLRKHVWGASDAEAVIQYRIMRAGEAIRSVKIILRATGKEPVVSRLMMRGADRGSFSNVHSIMSNDELREQTLGQAARDAEDYKARYRFLRETADIVRAIDAFLPKAARKRAAKK